MQEEVNEKTVALSFRAVKLTAEVLKKAIKPKLLGLFIGICTVGIIIVGYAFNAFQNLLI